MRSLQLLTDPNKFNLNLFNIVLFMYKLNSNSARAGFYGIFKRVSKSNQGRFQNLIISNQRKIIYRLKSIYRLLPRNFDIEHLFR